MKKKILFLVATHGDEGFSIPILRKLSNEGYDGKFDWIIGNPRALKIDKRFIDADLNRVAPGNSISSVYEIQRAYELQKKLNQYEYVIDVHGTSANTGTFVIITNPIINNFILASLLPIQNIVIWESSDLTKPGSLTRYTKCGLEIECGPKNSFKIQTSLYKILKYFLLNGLRQENVVARRKNYFQVYGKLMVKDFKQKIDSLEEFKQTRLRNEVFFPLLINRYPKIICYKMKKIIINL